MINEQKNFKEKNSFLQFIGKRSTIHGFALISSAFILTSSVFYIAAYSEPEAKNEKGEYVCKDAEVWNQKLICRISSPL